MRLYMRKPSRWQVDVAVWGSVMPLSCNWGVSHSIPIPSICWSSLQPSSTPLPFGIAIGTKVVDIASVSSI